MEIPQKKIKDKKYNNTPEYNKKYYSKHKAEIISTLMKKCVCDLCDRTVSYQRLRLHKTTALCQNNRKPETENLKDQIETLTQELNQLKAPST
jgi:hypothetical protein